MTTTPFNIIRGIEISQWWLPEIEALQFGMVRIRFVGCYPHGGDALSDWEDNPNICFGESGPGYLYSAEVTRARLAASSPVETETAHVNIVAKGKLWVFSVSAVSKDKARYWGDLECSYLYTYLENMIGSLADSTTFGTKLERHGCMDREPRRTR